MIDITTFCAEPTDLRSYLHHPFRHDGHIYATNGHVLIRIPDDGRDVPSGSPIDAGSARHTTDGFDGAQWFAISALPEIPPYVPMTDETKCKECGGAGFLECDLGHDHECGECDGTGRVDNQKPVEAVDVRIAGKLFDARLISLLPSTDRCALTVDHKLLAEGDGWRAVVMGLRDNSGKQCPEIQVTYAEEP